MTEEKRLRAAIENHRLAVGQAYGIGSFKRLHAVNIELWESISVPVSVQVISEDREVRDELHRPAMLENDQEGEEQ